jgi:hypothetical protein
MAYRVRFTARCSADETTTRRGSPAANGTASVELPVVLHAAVREAAIVSWGEVFIEDTQLPF